MLGQIVWTYFGQSIGQSFLRSCVFKFFAGQKLKPAVFFSFSFLAFESTPCLVI